ncbi:MAG: PEP-CTERM sorting domain-containing protein [Akkermansiaceae bacterium]
MKTKGLIKKGILALAVSCSSAQAGIVLGTTEPSADVLVDEIYGTLRVNTIINSTASQGSRGSGFSVAGTGQFDISAIVIDAGGNGALATGFEFTVSIIQAASGETAYDQTFTAVGGSSVTNAQFTSAIGGSLVGEETFAADGLVTAANQYLTFEFTNAIQVDAGTEYAVMIQTNGLFNQREGNNVTGDLNRILFNTASTQTPDSSTDGSRGLRFSVLGTAVPEPSSTALLGLGGLALILRRRK